MSDPRFARIKSDPRFRRPKKHQAKAIVDERFKGVFEKVKEKKGKSVRVDKYGRPISATNDQDNLRKFYRIEEDATEVTTKPDLARGEVLLESSDEDDDAEDESDNDSDPGRIITIGGDRARPITIPRDDEEAEIDLDEDTFADLEAQAAAYNKDRPDEDEEKEQATRTRRLAVVNLDWDHVRAGHLYKICSSLVSSIAPLLRASENQSDQKRRKNEGGQVNVVRGKVQNVRVYPSQFGQERMAKEEKEGPPPEIFKKKLNDDEEVDEKNIYDVGGENDYNEDALRKYQLERMRYYYAIITCDTVNAASHIYNELEGTELERSANVFDLSFVPDDMTFESEPRDEATENLNANNKGIDFVTDALRHSKVKLTWDEDDAERNQITRRTLTRKEIDEADFKAYLANTSSESEDDEPERASNSRQMDKKTSRDKVRALLLGGNDEAMPEGWGEDGGAAGDVDMEVTFTPGLTDKKGQDDENTLEKYQRKIREKKKRRKDEVKDASSKNDENVRDDFFDVESEDVVEVKSDAQSRTDRRQKKGVAGHHEKGDVEISNREVTAEELALLVASDNPNTEPRHFNLKSVIKAEKKKGRKGRKGKKEDQEDQEIQEDFVINVKDDRFKALHEDHQFAIDPSNPQFKKTKGMSALLEERQKRQREQRSKQEPEDGPASKRAQGAVVGDKSLQNLVESVKRKSAITEVRKGKRRKLEGNS